MTLLRMLLPLRISWRILAAHRLVPSITCRRTLSTYYDSQSGIHVPVHKDDEVTAYCSWNATEWNHDSNKLEALAKRGLGGVLIGPGSSHEEDPRNIHSMLTDMASHSWSRGFTVFLPSTLLQVPLDPRFQGEGSNDNVTVVFPLGSNDDEVQDIVTAMTRCVDQSISTALQCGHDDQDHDAMRVANQVAQILDDTGGGNHVLVAGADLVQLCEELCYLDLVGPTMKSRLVVQATKDKDLDNDETVEECLRMGINKFVVSEKHLSWLGQLVLAEGKSCTFQFG